MPPETSPVPHQDTPAAAAIRFLQRELSEHGISPTLVYEDGLPQLRVPNLVVWIDAEAANFFWSSCSGADRAERNPSTYPVRAARRITMRLRPFNVDNHTAAAR
ncbi:hypothetical protein [Streptosporangium longisporum]|uniref:Uncharacterized protein n=1 Tax=Streptosporangium longisporum TaxID=46187 RepID=A0ABP6L3T4_9ACTN